MKIFSFWLLTELMFIMTSSHAVLSVFPAQCAVAAVSQALDKRDPRALVNALRMPQLSLREVSENFVDFYFTRLAEVRDNRRVCQCLTVWGYWTPYC